MWSACRHDPSTELPRLARSFCALCSFVPFQPTPACKDMPICFCSQACQKEHAETGLLDMLSLECVYSAYQPAASSCEPTSPPHHCKTADTEQTTRAAQPDSPDTAAVATVTLVSGSSAMQRCKKHHQQQRSGQAIAAEYAQCAQTHPHLQRVAQVILPPCGERHPDSPAVVAAHEMLVCAAGLLDDKDWEEIMRVCDGVRA